MDYDDTLMYLYGVLGERAVHVFSGMLQGAAQGGQWQVGRK